MSHTPTPWHVDEFGRLNTETLAAKYPSEHLGLINNPEDAEFIVRACNAHEDMLEALKLVATGKPETELETYIIGKVKAAIAKAEGK